MIRRNFLRSAFAAAVLPLPLLPQEAAKAEEASEDYAGRIHTRINELRAARGVPSLAWSGPLAECAHEQSRRISQLRFHGHDDPERGGISTRLTTAGVLWTNCAENIFNERGYDDPVNFAVVCWWYSLGHQENIVNPVYTETGVGVVHAADDTFFVTQIFVKPLPPVRLSR